MLSEVKKIISQKTGDGTKIGTSHIFDGYMVKYVELVEGAMVRETYLSDDSMFCHETACIIEEEVPFPRA